MQDTTCDIPVLWLNPKAKYMCFKLNKCTGFLYFARVKQNKIHLCHIWTLGWRFSNMITHSCIKIVKGITESDVHLTCKQGREMIRQPDFINKIIVHVIYQTWDTVFHHQMKHREESWKYDAQRSIFDELRGVSSGDETLCRMFDITSQTKSFWRRN